VLTWIKPKRFFVSTCLLSIAGLLGIFLPFEPTAVVGFFLAGLGFANIFPLIFSITIDARPAQANALSGLMVTAIVGGAFLPPLMGLLSDATHSVKAGFVVPLAAILFITATAVVNLRSAGGAPSPA
jgi:MFS transporter, FHS family, L-fucose permease